MRVFGPSYIVDRLSEHMYVSTITMSGYMDRCSCYIKGGASILRENLKKVKYFKQICLLSINQMS